MVAAKPWVTWFGPTGRIGLGVGLEKRLWLEVGILVSGYKWVNGINAN